jgi:hypothetical protein
VIVVVVVVVVVVDGPQDPYREVYSRRCRRRRWTTGSFTVVLVVRWTTESLSECDSCSQQQF